MVEIVVPTIEEAVNIAAQARRADHVEAVAMGFKDAADGVQQSALWSSSMWAVYDWQGMPLAVFGVAPASILSDTGVPWMVATAMLDRHARTLMRLAPAYIDDMLSAYGRLQNCVHAHNFQAVGWLHRVGFQFDGRFIMPASREPFYAFSKVRD